jgi:hypothetical protein
MQDRRWDNEKLAFWLAPLASTVPLIPFFALRASPLFLGKFISEPTHPFLSSQWGPSLAAMAVVFDGTILAYVVAAPLFLMIDSLGKMSGARLLILFGLTGILASQLVRVLQDFRQPGLRDFAESWLSTLFGLLCGLASGTYFVLSRKRQFPPRARAFLYSLPVGILVACGTILMRSARARQ